MIWHYLSCCATPSGCRADRAKRFFARMHERLPALRARRRVPRNRPVVRASGTGWSGAAAYRAYQAAGTSAVACRQGCWRGAAPRPGARARSPARPRTRPTSSTTGVQLRLPIDPSLALYAAYWYRGVSCNPAAIAAKAAELAPDIRRVWVVEPRPGSAALPPGTDYVVAGTLAYYRAARPGPLAGQQRQLAAADRQAARHHARDDPPRHPAQDDGPGPGRPPGRRDGHRLRRADAPGRPVGLQRHARTRTPRWPGSGPTRRYETLEVGYPRNDRLAVATAEEIAAVREKLGLAPGPDRRALRADPPRVAAGGHAGAGRRGAGRAARPGHGAAGPRALLPRAGRPRTGRRDRRGRVVDVSGVPGGRGSLSRRGRADHRLLVGDVRLRGAGPADGDLRAGLAGLPGCAVSTST